MSSPLTRGALAVVGRRDVPRPLDGHALLSALPMPVVLLDAENRFRFANHAAEQFLGISLVQLTQLHLADLVPPDNPIFLLIEQVRDGEAGQSAIGRAKRGAAKLTVAGLPPLGIDVLPRRRFLDRPPDP